MLYLIVLSYQGPLSAVDAHLAEHRAYLARHYAAGHFLLSGPRDPRTGGVIMARADSRELVEAWVAEDPFHRAGVATCEIIAWAPSLRAGSIPVALAPLATLV
ncbi:YciI family protein [Zoogloeaceae bacterium G21618-S1]|jgi:uncharacterized protein YciI|nr:YciI family protein [Zoogloeaceae bacterium G21618-S1]